MEEKEILLTQDGYDKLEKELKNQNLKSLYLLYGEELFLLETTLKKINQLSVFSCQASAAQAKQPRPTTKN